MHLTQFRRRRFLSALLPVLTAASLVAQTPQIDQARAALDRGDSDAAVALLEMATVQSPQSAQAFYYLGKAYLDQGQNSGMFTAGGYVSKAKAALEKAVALDPKYVSARFALVQMYASLPAMMGGSIDGAVEQAKAIAPLDPIAGHRASAYIYIQQKKLDLANKEYADAVREQPNSPKAHSYLGQYLLNTEKNYAAAWAEFEAALKADPNYMPAFYHLGRTASLSGINLARGEEALKRYVGYTPKEDEPTLANANSVLGALYEKEGKKAEAKRSYEAALKLKPTLKNASEGLKRVS